MGWVMVWMPLILLLLGIPIFLLVLATCITAIVFFSSLPHAIIHQVLYDSVAKVPLVAVPFFLFTGDLMSRGGLSKRLLRWVASMVGGFRGSLPLTSLGFAAIFGAISGATTASVAAVGSITYPRLRAAGYSERFASALIVAECALDNLIPPSIAFIIYGIATETSVAHLFAAGILPGILLGGIFAIYIYLYSIRQSIDVRREIQLGRIPRSVARGHLAAGRDRRHLRRHLFGRVLADRGGRRLLRLCDVRGVRHLSRDHAARPVPDRGAHASC